MKILFTTFYLLTPLISVGEIHEDKVIEKISFGSCHRTGRNAQIWERIAETQPDLFLFMGDNVYADTEDMDKMKADYKALNNIPEYQALLKKSKILATWDDHDYGKNDAGLEYPMKKESRDIQLDAFAVPKWAPVRKREGLYQSYSYGSKGKKLQIILLDTRYFRTKLTKAVKVYMPSKGKGVSMLGEAQWTWLEKELKRPANLRIIVSSIQFLNQDHRFEKWANMPEEQQKMIDLLESTKTIKHTFFLSGDRHFSEISKRDFINGNSLYDITSSGMTHAGGGYKENNRYKLGKSYNKRNFGSLTINWKEQPEVVFNIHENDGNIIQKEKVEFK